MKKEAKVLYGKGVEALQLAVHHFNGGWDCGRVDATLIFLNHSFEMVLKAAILHRGGKIRKKREKQTIGFDECVRVGYSNGNVKFLSEEQSLELQAINSLRDAAEHHIVDVSEAHLAIHVAAGVTLFRDLAIQVFDDDLRDRLPERAVAVSTTMPLSLVDLFSNEVAEVRKLLQPGTRRRLDAKAKLRSLQIYEDALNGARVQPSEKELEGLASQVMAGQSWTALFPSVAEMEVEPSNTATKVDFRIVKKGGTPVRVVKEGEGEGVVAIRRVDELAYYSLGLNDLAEKLEITPPKCLALIRSADLQSNLDYFKEIVMGKVKAKRYSGPALKELRRLLNTADMNAVWEQYGSRRSGLTSPTKDSA